MGHCNIDHSHDDVVKKFASQKEFLPGNIMDNIEGFLQYKHSQETLNELFHLLKKYDLATVEERAERNEKIITLTK